MFGKMKWPVKIDIASKRARVREAETEIERSKVETFRQKEMRATLQTAFHSLTLCTSQLGTSNDVATAERNAAIPINQLPRIAEATQRNHPSAPPIRINNCFAECGTPQDTR